MGLKVFSANDPKMQPVAIIAGVCILFALAVSAISGHQRAVEGLDLAIREHQGAVRRLTRAIRTQGAAR